jgi:uncharacterized coiled-coil DUF342 family protein
MSQHEESNRIIQGLNAQVEALLTTQGLLHRRCDHFTNEAVTYRNELQACLEDNDLLRKAIAESQAADDERMTATKVRESMDQMEQMEQAPLRPQDVCPTAVVPRRSKG